MHEKNVIKTGRTKAQVEIVLRRPLLTKKDKHYTYHRLMELTAKSMRQKAQHLALVAYAFVSHGLHDICTWIDLTQTGNETDL